MSPEELTDQASSATEQKDPRIKAILFDFGDTLAPESSQVLDETGATIEAELFLGVEEVLKTLQEKYPLAILADCVPGTGRVSYDNVLRQHSIEQLFQAVITSDEVGVNKPHRYMFEAALAALDINSDAAGYTVMVGNRIDRDILGANRFGMKTVWANLAPTYRKVPHLAEEEADWKITSFDQLLGVIADIEVSLRSRT